jgi:hypothetical protein
MPTADLTNTEYVRRLRSQVMANGFFPIRTPKDITVELQRKFGNYKYIVNGRLRGIQV